MISRLARINFLRVTARTQPQRIIKCGYSTDYDHRPSLGQYTEAEQCIIEVTNNFCKRSLSWDVVRDMDKVAQLRPEILTQLFEEGLMGIEIPEQYGGAGLSFMNSIVAIEELAKFDPTVSVVCDVHNTLVNRIFLQYGSETVKEKFLPRLAADTLGSFCLSESGSGSDAFALKTTATPIDGGNKYVLNGSKSWITNAYESGIFVVMATVDPSKGHRGITAFVVDKSNPGLKIGKKEDKLGIRASSTCEVILDECVVDKDDMLGELGKGYKIAIETLNEGRIGIGAQMVGLAQGAFDYALPYIIQRQQFGQSISSFQGMQFQYAKAAVDIRAARLMVYDAARMKEQGLNFQKEAAMAKYYSSEVAHEVATKCIEWLGGVGFTKEFQAEKFYRDCIIGKIYEGTSNINLQTIAKLIVKDYQQ
ncbi:short-chain 2-methylacyl-CoA dehydrogenase [Acrasis kona]|uniref:Short/branched chain specific acyl-CoA dehydrogenase, mitochondrial n=1 Tax=Acrasis kona TaxID=1008807 RepID=A0AAW2YZQ1_9EUKA